MKRGIPTITWNKNMEELTDQDCLAKQSFVDARDGANRKSFL